MFTVRCDDLGIRNCQSEVQGVTPTEVITQVKEHLVEHGFDLPSSEEIMGVSISSDRLLFGSLDKDVDLIVTRLRADLGIESSGKPEPSIGRTAIVRKVGGGP